MYWLSSKLICLSILIKLSALIHGFTIPVPILIFPIYWQLLLRNGKISSKYLFWKERTQRWDSIWQHYTYFKSTLNSLSIIQSQILIQMSSATKSSITWQQIEKFSGDAAWLLQLWFAGLLWLFVERAFTFTSNSRKAGT